MKADQKYKILINILSLLGAFSMVGFIKLLVYNKKYKDGDGDMNNSEYNIYMHDKTK